MTNTLPVLRWGLISNSLPIHCLILKWGGVHTEPELCACTPTKLKAPREAWHHGPFRSALQPLRKCRSIISLLLAGKASTLLYSVLQCRIHAGSDQALRETRNGNCMLNLTTDKNIWNSPDFSLQEAKAMLREAIISFFPES